VAGLLPAKRSIDAVKGVVAICPGDGGGCNLCVVSCEADWLTTADWLTLRGANALVLLRNNMVGCAKRDVIETLPAELA